MSQGSVGLDDIGRRILRPAAASKKLSMSRTTLWREVKAGRIRAPIKLTERIRGWTDDYLDQLIEARSRETE